MKTGYMILLITTSVFALIYGLLNQLAGNIGWAFGYVCLVMFGATLMYLVGWRYSIRAGEKEDENDKSS